MNDDDFPELTDEMVAELQASRSVDLHLGPATVKASDDWWIKQYGPKPPSPAVRMLDVSIALLVLANVYLILKIWIWMFTS